MVRLSCTSAKACDLTGSLSVVRTGRVHGKLVRRRVFLAELHRAVLTPRTSRLVGFPLTAAGKATFVHLAKDKKYRATLILNVLGGRRVVQSVTIG